MAKLDVDILVRQLRDAAAGANAPADVVTLLKQAVADPASVAAGMPEYPDDDVVLFEDDSVSIWHCRFQPNFLVPPHDHQTWATIGVYQGTEINRFYVRDDDALVHRSTKCLGPGNVISIGPNGIHTVQAEGDEPSCAIHVYLAALTTIERSLFDWYTGEPSPFTDANYARLLRSG